MVNSWPGVSRTGPACERAQPDLRPLQVGEHAHAVPRRVGRRPDLPVDGQVPVLAAVAHVQPGHVHARGHQAGHLVRGAGRGPERANDFGPAAATAAAVCWPPPVSWPLLRPRGLPLATRIGLYHCRIGRPGCRGLPGTIHRTVIRCPDPLPGRHRSASAPPGLAALAANGPVGAAPGRTTATGGPIGRPAGPPCLRYAHSGRPTPGVGRSARRWKKAQESVRQRKRRGQAGYRSATVRAFPHRRPATHR